MDESLPAIDSARLRALLDGVNRHGCNPHTGGFDRVAFSASDHAVRQWFVAQMRNDGLKVRHDAVGNLFGRFGPADGPCLLVGSHLDTVPNGGAFDGALGVCIALECVRALRACGVEPRHAIEVVATSDEEGRFGGMLGSQALVGQITQAWVESSCDADGVALGEAMRAQGYDPSQAHTAALDPASVIAFLELHIEQGPMLIDARVPIGLVDTVSGVCHLGVRLTGAANHSGTTPMTRRSDAFAGLAAVGSAIPDLIRRLGTEQSRITIGKVELRPNHPHTIAGEAQFSVIVRDIDETVMRALHDDLQRQIVRIAEQHKLHCQSWQNSWLPPVQLDATLLSLAQATARSLDLPFLTLPSGAGHDAQTLQSRWPSALIFVPSRDGVSHAPQEWTDWADIEAGAALMLALLRQLCTAEGACVGRGAQQISA